MLHIFENFKTIHMLSHKNHHVLARIPDIDRAPSVCIHVIRAATDDVRLRRTATTLAEAGWRVTVVDIIGTSTREHHDSFSMPQVPPYVFQHINVSSDFRKQRFADKSTWKLLQIIIYAIITVLKQPADVYHACEWTALPACSLAALIHRKPLIFEAYELPLQDYILRATQKRRRLLYAWMHLLLRFVLPRCAAVIAVSPPIVYEMQNAYHIPHITLIRNIPSYQAITKTQHLKEHLRLSAQTRIALYQGNIQPDRGLDLLVQAATYLEPECILVIMGQNIGTTQNELEELIMQQHVNQRVKIIPAVPYEILPAWTASADIGLTVIPLDYTKNMLLCLPNKFFEYVHAGLPVLSSPLPAVQELLEKYKLGKVISSLRPADVGAAINTLLSNSIERNQMRKNALQAAQQDLCWEKESQHLIQLYQHVMHTQKKPNSYKRLFEIFISSIRKYRRLTSI